MSEVGKRKDDLDTPSLWVDLDKMENNIATLAAQFKKAGVDWRPHTKGIKVPAIAHKAIAAGAMGVTCAKLGEAEIMVAAGIGDILVANQVVGPRKIARLVNLVRQADVKVAVESAVNIAEIGRIATEHGVEVDVLVELNTGMERAGVLPGAPTVEMSRIAHETPGVRYRGVMAWEGHTSMIEDRQEKRQVIEEVVGLLVDSAEQCRQAGLPVDIVSAGGSNTYHVTPFIEGITEIQAGGAIFNDVTYRSRHVDTEPAIFVRATVTSRPTPQRIIFDVGFKSLPTWYRDPELIGVNGVEKVNMSAEHGQVFLAEPNEAVQVGDAFDFIVGYTDCTLFLYNEIYGVREGGVEAVWPIQGRGMLR